MKLRTKISQSCLLLLTPDVAGMRVIHPSGFTAGITMKSICIALLSTALLGLANPAYALKVGNPNSTGMNDFHITFDKPPTGKIIQTKTGNAFQPNPLNQNEIVSSAFSVGALGSGTNNNEMTIKGLTVVGANTFAGRARVVSWCWSKDGLCTDSTGTPWLLPYVVINLGNGLQNLTLQQLDGLGYTISAVPEPAVALMAISGIAFIGLWRRRKNIT
jgi:hypothetical protein